MSWIYRVTFLVLAAGQIGIGAESPMRPARLRCEYMENPLGIDTPAPRLSWVLESDRADQAQAAYQIQVATSRQLRADSKADLWDSGRVASSESIQITYSGKALASRQQCWWRVRTWDGNGGISAWSEASFSIGLLNAGDWEAKWITSPVRTTAAETGLGYHAAEAEREDDVQWVQVDLRDAVEVEAICIHPAVQTVNGKKIDGFAFPHRFRVEVSDEAAFREPVVIADHTAEDFANPGRVVVSLDGRSIRARHVRITATKLWNRNTGPKPYCFALAEVQVIAGGRNVAAKTPVSAKDSTEAHGWGKAQLTDGRGMVEDKPREPDPDAIILRRQFQVDKPIARATIYICGLGHYELRLNGEKVGDRVLEPGWTNYRRTCLYSTYDVTQQLKQGGNALGIMLGNGMYNVVGGRYIKFTGSFGPPKAIAQVDIEHTDGSATRIVTDENWKATSSPITFTCIYGGEDYDARQEQDGWDKPGFAEGARWKPAIIADGPGGALRAQMMRPIKVRRTLTPASRPRLIQGGCVYDLGQNFSGWPILTVKGPAGATVRMVPAERMAGDVADQSTSGGPTYFTYTLKGSGSEVWSPRFTYTGFRYVRVEGAVPAGEQGSSGMPVIERLEGQVIYPDVPTVGEFACSNALFNRTHEIINWAIISNMKSVMTDCPHREKLGWLEETHLMGPGIMFNYDVAALYGKIAKDMAEAQLANGLVPDIAPEYPIFAGGFRDSPEWGSAAVVSLWQTYQTYGDTRILADHYEMMKRYVAYLGSTAKNHVVSHGLGDWYDIGPKGPGPSQNTPMAVTATLMNYEDARILAQVARLLGRADDAGQYDRLAADIKAQFSRRFFNAGTNEYATGSQTANAMALVMGVVEPERRNAVLKNLIRDIRLHGNHTSAGDVGHRYVLLALAEGGRSDVVFDMASQTDHPSYGYQVRHGATSLTEAWDGPTRGASQNHFMLGHIEEWFYRSLAGINVDLSAEGARRITIRPDPVGDVTWVKATYDSIFGPIGSEWTTDGVRFTLTVSIPANTRAVVHVPGGEIREVGSGRHTFTAPARLISVHAHPSP